MTPDCAFKSALQYGAAGETLIAKWLRRRGWSVLPVYEIEQGQWKGPRLFMPKSELIVPDMLAFRDKEDCAFWIEAKHKTAFTFHRNTQRWVTGIDLPHFRDYCRVNDETPWPVWLMFLHEGGQAKDSPAQSPAGLYGNTIKYLRENVNHEHANGGRHGMVYWAEQHLRRIAPLADVSFASPTQNKTRQLPILPGDESQI